MTRVAVRFLLVLTSLLACSAPARAEEPLRVVLPPVPSLATAEQSGPLLASLTLYLHERLGECEAVRVVSNGRAAAILSELTGGKRDHSPEKLLQEFSEYMPVDVLVECGGDAATVRLHVHTKQGVLQHDIPSDTPTPVQALVRKAAEILADDLKLPAAQKKLLLETRIKDPAAFEAYYTSQVLGARWPDNSGEARLHMLRAVLEKNRKDPYLAAQILRNAELLFENARRKQDFAESAWTMAKFAIEPVLGTQFEESAYNILRRKPEAFEKDLISLSRPLPGELFDEGGDLPEADKEDAADDFDPAQAPDGMERHGTLEKRLGALRLLGFIQSKDGYERILVAAKNEDARVREAAATALRFYTDEQSLEVLKRLARDDDESVALTAGHGLWKRGKGDERLLPLARKALERGPSDMAVEVVSATSTRDDLPALWRVAGDVKPSVRRQAVNGVLRLSGADDQLLYRFLNDADEAVVLEALAAFPANGGAEPVKLAVGLANDAFGPIAEAARLALSAYRPRERREQILFDLAIEHPYVRMKLLDVLALMNDAQSLDELEDACANRHAHARAHALAKLMERSPDRGRKAVAVAIRDPYRWVRLHAAARLAEAADAGCAGAIKLALESEKDAATRLYLADALAKAEGRPLPPPQPAVRSVKGERNLTWLCEHGLDSESSPFDCYYKLSINVNEAWKKGYAAGKVFFARVNTAGHPGLIILDPAWEDQFWLAMEAELTDGNLPYLDGFVFGEESMSMAPDSLWAPGWRLFCLDAGIDPSRVKGDMTNLNVYEMRAWKHWALERAVDGFNELYDYTKLKYGKLRPGMQVATFLPEQGMLGPGASPADARWKFDVGGAYDYKGCNRMAAYGMVRRYKTLWPDRPVIWLSLGVGGYEMNPVKRTQQVPSALMTDRWNRSWADSVSAYIAGADTGWFSVWIFVEKDWKGSGLNLRGVQVGVEDIFPISPVLERAIGYSFHGAEADYEAPPPPRLEEEKLGAAEEEAETEEELGLEHEDVKKERIRKAIEEHKQKFRLGFYAYGKYVYDCARALEGLPRQNARPPALLIRPNVSVWTRPPTQNPLIPAEALLTSYDFLCDVNQVSNLDLSRYRLIIIHDPGPLMDETIAALTRWLKEQPGLLYVHRALSGDNADEASRPDDHDGILKNDWPWEADVSVAPAGPSRKPERCALSGQAGEVTVEQACVVGNFTVTGKSAQALFSRAGKPALVLWQRESFKGAVLFDGIESASAEYLVALRQQLNKAHEALGVGIRVDGPVLHQVARDDNIVAAACTGYYRQLSTPLAYSGVDLMSGEKNPVVGGGRSGVLCAKECRGRYVAAVPGVTVLCEKPITKLEKVDGGMVVQSPGLMRAASASGAVKLRPEGGDPLPIVESPFEWILTGETEGTVSLPLGKTGSALTYFRCDRPVRVMESEALKENEE